MPFTLSHPAAVLLLRGTPLPVAAMVAGSMTPDAPMFIRVRGAYDLTHSLVGVVTIDLALSAVAVVFWFAMIRDPLADLVPAVRERVAPTVRYSALQWKLAVPAAVLGSLTHVVWDAFTHDGRWGVRHVTWLHELHRGHTGAEWAQYGSSVIGLVAVAAWAIRELRTRPRVPRPATVAELGTRAAAAIGAVTLGSGIAAAFTTAPPGWRMMLSQAAVVGTIMGAFSLLVVAGIWQMMTNRVDIGT